LIFETIPYLCFVVHKRIMKYQDLKILDELREKGSISEEEYQREKRHPFTIQFIK
jgi:uncharacterized membrane protein